MGWATMNGGTTGGGNATPIVVTSLSELNSQAGGSVAKVIYVKGQFSGSLSVGSNKTIIGLPGAKITNASFSGSKNVIIRNLIIKGGTDTIVTSGAKNIWFDHLDLSDGSDGVMDLCAATDFITVSYTKYWYARGGDHKCCVLVGNRDDATGDRGHNNVTFYKCWWAEGVMERMPRVRFGNVQVLNCLYTAAGNVYCIAPGVEANVRAEKNIFINVNSALAADWYNSTPDATLAEIGNVFLGTTTGRVGKYGDPVFVPPYSYVADEPTDALEAEIRANAGATMNISQP
jgi:pectate lyase